MEMGLSSGLPRRRFRIFVGRGHDRSGKTGITLSSLKNRRPVSINLFGKNYIGLPFRGLVGDFQRSRVGYCADCAVADRLDFERALPYQVSGNEGSKL